jgi:hypothetical protein
LALAVLAIVAFAVTPATGLFTAWLAVVLLETRLVLRAVSVGWAASAEDADVAFATYPLLIV